MKSKTLKSLKENIEGAVWLWDKTDTNHQEDVALKPYVVLGKPLRTHIQGDTHRTVHRPLFVKAGNWTQT